MKRIVTSVFLISTYPLIRFISQFLTFETAYLVLCTSYQVFDPVLDKVP